MTLLKPDSQCDLHYKNYVNYHVCTYRQPNVMMIESEPVCFFPIGVIFTTQDVVVTETDEDQTVSVCVTMTPPSGGLDRVASVSVSGTSLMEENKSGTNCYVYIYIWFIIMYACM